jgi:Raf kinase inhibitor-like YbhB/YbcL family protein
MEDLRLTSPAFDHGERIPEKYGYTAENTNPPLDVGGVPDEAVSLVLVVDDPDAKDPADKVWDHWVVWNVPAAQTHIPEDWSPDEAVEGQNDYGEVGWGGPNPPDREHTYRFVVYALDTTLDLPAGASKDDVYYAASGHTLAKGELTGTYPA